MRNSLWIAAISFSLIASESLMVAAQELHCYAGWTAAYKCMEHCGPCGGGSARSPVIYRPSAPPQPDPATVSISDGDAAAARRDWDAAILAYRKALELRPGDEATLASLRNAMAQRQMEINSRIDTADAATLQAFLDRSEDHEAAASLQSALDQAEDEQAAARLSAIYDTANSDPGMALPSADLTRSVQPPTYPIFARPAPPDSPPVKILAQLQPDVRAIDKQIQQAQTALRALIKANATDAKEREYWVGQLEETTIEAQDLSISLIVDAFGARADELSAKNNEKREQVLSRLIAECDANGPSPRVVSGYKTLLGTKRDLDRLHQEIRLAGKENDLRVRIRDFSMNEAEPNLETVWDVASQFQIVEDLTGPWADMLNAGYTLYRQALNVQHLSDFQINNEKTYEASKTLGLLIRRLEAQKQQAKAAQKVR